jgi:hypothetical protein
MARVEADAETVGGQRRVLDRGFQLVEAAAVRATRAGSVLEQQPRALCGRARERSISALA